MARYITETELNKPIDVVSMVMEDFVYHEGYIRGDWNGEMVFMKEDIGHYMLWYYAAGILHIEAWKKGIMGGEAAPGPMVIAEISGVISRIRRQDESKVAGGHIGSDPLHHDSGHTDNHTAWTQDTAWQGKQSASTSGRVTSDGISNKTNRPAPDTFRGAAFVLIFAFMMMAIFPVFSIILAAFCKAGCKRSRTPGNVICSLLASLLIIANLLLMVCRYTSLMTYLPLGEYRRMFERIVEYL